jgi:hypothetical protein
MVMLMACNSTILLLQFNLLAKARIQGIMKTMAKKIQ